MPIGRLFDWFQFAVLICLLLVGAVRMLRLRAQGVRVLVADLQRSVGQIAGDLLGMICLLLWGGEIIAQASLGHMLLIPSSPAIMPMSGVPVRPLGGVIEIAGLCIYGIAVRDLGASWRMGIDRAAPGPLVTTGIYGRMRHPIYVAFDLLFVGPFLVLNRGVMLALTVAMIPWLHTVMLREERYLAQRFGDSYHDYCSRVGRYWTWKRGGRLPADIPRDSGT